ncbi:phosphate uptake regulator PhoU [Candidatus Woesearchaeota archaeon]|nr:phosphate uptake regulator PhoU [Candidatus Woesearchaeota archaeon]
MRRKIIKQGAGGLTLCIPKKWAERNNLKPGDEVEVSETEQTLTILPKPSKTQESLTITLNATNYDRSSFLRLLLASYHSGYDEIRIEFENDEFLDYEKNKIVKISEHINKYVERLIGIEVVSQGEKYYLLKDITTESESGFNNVMRRIFFLSLEFMNALTDGLKSKNYSELSKASERHDNIDKFLNYCLRLLNKKQLREPVERNNLFHIIMSLDEIIDQVRFCCQDILKINSEPSQETIKIIISVTEYFRLFHNLFFDFNVETLKRISKLRYTIQKQIQKAKSDEKGMVDRVGLIVEIIHGLLIPVLAINQKSVQI